MRRFPGCDGFAFTVGALALSRPEQLNAISHFWLPRHPADKCGAVDRKNGKRRLRRRTGEDQGGLGRWRGTDSFQEAARLPIDRTELLRVREVHGTVARKPPPEAKVVSHHHLDTCLTSFWIERRYGTCHHRH